MEIENKLLHAIDEISEITWYLRAAEAALADDDIGWPCEELKPGITNVILDQIRSLKEMRQYLAEWGRQKGFVENITDIERRMENV